jgi:hypothetical protein
MLASSRVHPPARLGCAGLSLAGACVLTLCVGGCAGSEPAKSGTSGTGQQADAGPAAKDSGPGQQDASPTYPIVVDSDRRRLWLQLRSR